MHRFISQAVFDYGYLSERVVLHQNGDGSLKRPEVYWFIWGQQGQEYINHGVHCYFTQSNQVFIGHSLKLGHNLVKLFRWVALLSVCVEGLCKHVVFMGITDDRNLLAEAINPSQDLNPSYLITISHFAKDKI